MSDCTCSFSEAGLLDLDVWLERTRPPLSTLNGEDATVTSELEASRLSLAETIPTDCRNAVTKLSWVCPDYQDFLAQPVESLPLNGVTHVKLNMRSIDSKWENISPFLSQVVTPNLVDLVILTKIEEVQHICKVLLLHLPEWPLLRRLHLLTSNQGDNIRTGEAFQVLEEACKLRKVVIQTIQRGWFDP